MAYNKQNYYKRIIEIQDIVLKYQELDLKNTTIFKKYIAKKYHISKRTFDEYLGVPAKAKLKQLIEKAQGDKDQLKLF